MDRLIYKIDIRFKWICISLISFSIMNGKFFTLLAMTNIAFLVSYYYNISIFKIFNSNISFFLFFLFIFLSRLFIQDTDKIFNFNISYEKVLKDFLFCWKFIIIFLFAVLFVSTSKLSDIQAGIVWFLKPFPFMPKEKFSIMVALLIRFFPLMIEQIQKVFDANKSRCIDNRKNPIYKFKMICIPIIKNFFLRSENFASSMESRCYNKNRANNHSFNSNYGDWFIVFTLILICFLLYKT